MSVIGWFALIAIAVTLAKIIVILINQELWLDNAVKVIWSCPPAVVSFLSIAVAAGILIVLLGELSIVQIWAVFLLFMALMVAGFAPFAGELKPFAESIYRQPGLALRAFWAFVAWAVLGVWGLVALFL